MTSIEETKEEVLQRVRNMNEKVSWRDRVSIKKVSKAWDATHTPEYLAAEPREPKVTNLPLQELVAEILKITNSEYDSASTQTFMDMCAELEYRDAGLYDIISGDITEDAQKRIDKLNSILVDITPATWDKVKCYICSEVPNVLSYDLDSTVNYTKSNVAFLYRGDVNDKREFMSCLLNTAVTEANKRAWLHEITHEEKDSKNTTVLNVYRESMRTAIIRELYKVIDLVNDPMLDLDEVLQSTLLLLCERFFDELHKTQGTELKKSLFRIARKNAKIYTKTLTREAGKQRTLKDEDFAEFIRIFPEPDPTGDYGERIQPEAIIESAHESEFYPETEE
jgi:hypothetical protein